MGLERLTVEVAVPPGSLGVVRAMTPVERGERLLGRKIAVKSRSEKIKNKVEKA